MLYFLCSVIMSCAACSYKDLDTKQSVYFKNDSVFRSTILNPNNKEEISYHKIPYLIIKSSEKSI